MNLSNVFAAVIVMSAATASAQRPYRPAAPIGSLARSPKTLGDYEKEFHAIAEKRNSDKVWTQANDSKLDELMREMNDLRAEIQALPIGPPPRRPLPRPTSTPVVSRPPGKPTKNEFSENVQELHAVLEEKSKSNANAQLSEATAKQLKRVLDSLSTVR